MSKQRDTSAPPLPLIQELMAGGKSPTGRTVPETGFELYPYQRAVVEHLKNSSETVIIDSLFMGRPPSTLMSDAEFLTVLNTEASRQHERPAQPLNRLQRLHEPSTIIPLELDPSRVRTTLEQATKSFDSSLKPLTPVQAERERPTRGPAKSLPSIKVNALIDAFLGHRPDDLSSLEQRVMSDEEAVAYLTKDRELHQARQDQAEAKRLRRAQKLRKLQE